MSTSMILYGFLYSMPISTKYALQQLRQHRRKKMKRVVPSSINSITESAVTEQKIIKKVATVAQRSTWSVIFVNGPLLLLCPNNCSIVSYDLHSFLCLSFSRSHFDHHHHQKRLIYHYHHLQIHILVRLFPFLIFFFSQWQKNCFSNTRHGRADDSTAAASAVKWYCRFNAVACNKSPVDI